MLKHGKARLLFIGGEVVSFEDEGVTSTEHPSRSFEGAAEAYGRCIRSCCWADPLCRNSYDKELVLGIVRPYCMSLLRDPYCKRDGPKLHTGCSGGSY